MAAYSRLPVQWEKKDILVMGEVRVCSPYDSDCVTGGSNAANNRVKKVVSVNTNVLSCILPRDVMIFNTVFCVTAEAGEREVAAQ